ncbi:hypothetical protein PHYBOEH_004066 [Phytophthora boehmeriae]|uniref:RxLR effector protein n=1 Tax=Phytophthora boehmeriae TaxID=109152 RepID=A0A8T1X4F3_9STRA|nr:hypothetical protein PHYBOEH_004066 [Phytophthora boehmeriae]
MSRSYFLLLLIAAVGLLLASGEVLSNDKAAAVAPLAPSHGVELDIVAVKRSLRTEDRADGDDKALNTPVFNDSSLTSDEERGFSMAGISAAALKVKNNPHVLKITAQVKSAMDKLKANPQFIKLSQQIKAKSDQVKANPTVVKLKTELKNLKEKVIAWIDDFVVIP